MTIKEFAQQFKEEVSLGSELNQSDYETELASSILEYLEDNGEVNVPEICTFKKTRARITAYDYNVEAESLDLFYLIRSENILGKVNNSRIQQGFNYLKAFYKGAMDESIFRSSEIEKSDEIAEVAKLVQSSKGSISQLRLYIITDGLTDPASVPESEDSKEGDFIIEYNVWDMQRIYRSDIVLPVFRQGVKLK